MRYERTDVRLRGVLVVIAADRLPGLVPLLDRVCGSSATTRPRRRSSGRRYPLAPAPSSAAAGRAAAGAARPHGRRREAQTSTCGRKPKETILNSYGPTDEKGFVHIPIEPGDASWWPASCRPARRRRAGRRKTTAWSTAASRTPAGCFGGNGDDSATQARQHPRADIAAHETIVGCVRCLLPAAAACLPGVGRTPNPTLPPPLRDVGFDQKLNEQVPLDLAFRDEAGRAGQARRLFRRQAGHPGAGLLPLPDALHAGAQRPGPGPCSTCRSTPGKDFDVVTVSFDPRETPDLAAAKKQTYVRALRPARRRAEGWHFLTGDAGRRSTG